MFLIAVTYDPIDARFPDATGRLTRDRVGPLTVTAVTDGFLSQLTTGATGFSLIESPVAGTAEAGALVLSGATLDRQKGELSVFQDTDSARPIYYHLNAAGEFFCSTHVSMLRRAGVPIAENTEALPEFFAYRYVAAPRTLYKGIDRLAFGGGLRVAIAAGGCRVEHVRRYDPFAAGSVGRLDRASSEQAISRAGEAISRSVDILSPCSDRLAVLLSGGLDSSVLFAACRERFGTGWSYSASYPFEDPANDRERQYALSAAAALKSEHLWYEASNGEYLHGFLEAIQAAEEPLHHMQSVMLHLLMKNAVPGGSDVVLCAGGADTVFGLEFQNRLFRWNSSLPYRLMAREPLLSAAKWAARLMGRGSDFVSKAEEVSKNIGRDIRDPYNLVYSEDSYGTEDWVCDHFGVTRQDIVEKKIAAVEASRGRSLYERLSVLGLGDLSATNGIWSKLAEGSRKVMYYPLTDGGVLESGFAVDWETKLRQPKHVLRRVAADLGVPRFIIDRPKASFGVSPARWAGPGGVLEPLVPLASRCFDPDVIARVRSVDPASAVTFWNILNYSIWKRLCVDLEPLETLSEELERSIAERA